jgi:hypothetical protein
VNAGHDPVAWPAFTEELGGAPAGGTPLAQRLVT